MWQIAHKVDLCNPLPSKIARQLCKLDLATYNYFHANLLGDEMHTYSLLWQQDIPVQVGMY